MLNHIAAVFRALGEPMRLRILEALGTAEQSVNQLVAATGTSQPNVSKHLGLLLNAGLVRRRKDGVSVYYSVAGDVPLRLLHLAASKIEDAPWQTLRSRIKFGRTSH